MHTRTVIFSCVEMESFCVFLPLCDIFHHPLLDYMASIIHVTLFPPGTRVAIPMGLRQMRWCPLKQHGSVPTGRPASQVIKEVKGSVIFHPTIQFSILSALYLQLSITFISLPLSPTMTPAYCTAAFLGLIIFLGIPFISVLWEISYCLDPMLSFFWLMSSFQ